MKTFRTLFLFALLLLHLADATAQSIWNVNSGADTITEVDLYTGAVLNTLPTPVPTHVPFLGGPEGLAFDGFRLYFSSGNASLHGHAGATNRTVYYLDPITGAVLGSYVFPAITGGDLDQAIDALAVGDYGGVPTLFANRPALDEVYLVDLSTNTLYATLSLPFHGIGGMGYAPHHQTLFISESTTDTIHEIDPATGTILNTLSIAPDGGLLGVDIIDNKLFVAANHSGDLIELSPVTGVEINRYPAPTSYPSALAGGPAILNDDPDCGGEVLFSVNSTMNTYSILDVNTGVEQARFLTPIPTYPPGGIPYGGPEGLAYDGTVLYYISGDDPDPARSATIYTIDPCTGSVLGVLAPPFPATAGDPTIDALAYGEYGGIGRLFALRPDGNQIFEIDPASGAITNTLTVGANAIGGLGFDGVTQTLFVSDFNAAPNVLLEVDPASGAVLNTLTMPAPYLLGVDFVHDRLFGALDDGTGTIYEFDLAGTVLNSFAAPDAMPSALAGPPALGADVAGVEIVLTPHSDPVEVGAGGGTVTFDVTVTNLGSASATVDVWLHLLGPGVDFIRGPFTATLGAGETRTRTTNQHVPASAPAGAYTLTGKLGTFPATVDDEDGFGFTKAVAAPARRPGRPAVADWTTTDARSGQPLVPGTPFAVIERALAMDVPDGGALEGNYPNPFNPTTVLAFTLPEAAPARLTVYDLLGREVARLADGFLAAGRHTVRFDATGLSAGTYLYHLEAGAFVQTRRMTLLK